VQTNDNLLRNIYSTMTESKHI